MSHRDLLERYFQSPEVKKFPTVKDPDFYMYLLDTWLTLDVESDAMDLYHHSPGSIQERYPCSALRIALRTIEKLIQEIEDKYQDTFLFT
jgi:hypothetical protein